MTQLELTKAFPSSSTMRDWRDVQQQ